MSPLSARAANILEQMEPDRAYEPAELRRFVPDLSMDSLREVMHELWIERRVERFRYSGWMRVRSTPSPETSHSTNIIGIKPEDLFDHDAFEGLFK